jgi:hypothetical protein
MMVEDIFTLIPLPQGYDKKKLTYARKRKINN